MQECSQCGASAEIEDGRAPLCMACTAAQTARIGFHESRDAEGEQHWTPGMEQLFGLSPGTFERTYAGWVKRIHPSDRDTFENARRACIEQRQPGFKYQYRVLLPDGQVRWIEERSRLFYSESGALERIVGASIDVTELRDGEPAATERPADPAPSSEEIQRFVYAVTHDLQEPLRGIGTMTELFRTRAGGSLDPESGKLLDAVVSNVHRMKRLIQDVLEFARIGHEAGPTRVAVDTQAVVGAVIKNLREAVDESGANVTCDSLPVIHANEGQLSRVFQNLIANAIKYHGEHAPEVRISALRDGDEWTFSVRDNGIGIDPRYHHKIFGTFQRLHSRSEYEGNGFGLAICERIIRRHDGRIWVKSESGKGATFYFTLPERAREVDGRKPSGKSTPAQSRAASDSGL